MYRIFPSGYRHRQGGQGEPQPMPGYLVLLYLSAHKRGGPVVLPCAAVSASSLPPRSVTMSMGAAVPPTNH